MNPNLQLLSPNLYLNSKPFKFGAFNLIMLYCRINQHIKTINRFTQMSNAINNQKKKNRK